ncbi:uncharacterized protein LOC117117699 [Anneissia japonica]|uniref:uncharacterized protein LOC117117699 n=1 Tax=Anneissia japonica TaxID=1529436 RepID=UPI0014256C93|nr:uncharacterized protein LOC117117699 [Anneissia japonica]
MGVSCSRGDDVLVLAGYHNNEVPSFKIVLVGDEKVGKSSIFMRYFRNQFDYSYRPTASVHIENVVKKLNVPEHAVVSVTIWDLPGREEVDLRKSYYQNVDAAIVVVDASDRGSIELAGSWKQDVCNNATVSQATNCAEHKTNVTYVKGDRSSIPVLLLGNKYDLVEEREELEMEKNERNNKEEVRSIGKIQTIQEQSEGELDQKKDVDEQVWKYEEQQVDKTEPVPEEIKFLQSVAEQHGFVGSVAVSAKDSDGSVHIAIQALIRHLLERKLKDSAIKKMEAVTTRRMKHKKVVKDEQNEFQPLQTVGVKELDDLFLECDEAIRLAGQLAAGFSQALKQFKKDCFCTGMIEKPKASLEDCIEGIKQAMDEDQELVAVNDSGFLQLAVKGEMLEEEEKSEDMKKVMLTFHSEVLVSSKAILQHCPRIDTHLSKMDAKILNQCKSLPDSLTQQEHTVTTRNIEHMQFAIDNNRARIKLTRSQASTCLQDVDNAYKKIKASLIW